MNRKFVKFMSIGLTCVSLLSFGGSSLADTNNLENVVSQNSNFSYDSSSVKSLENLIQEDISNNPEAESGEISQAEFVSLIKDAIMNDNSINSEEKQSKISEIDKIVNSNGRTGRVNSGPIRWTRPGPGRLRIFLSPICLQIAVGYGIAAYVTYVVLSLATGGVAVGVTVGFVANAIAVAINNQNAMKKGMTLHFWKQNGSGHMNASIGNNL